MNKNKLVEKLGETNKIDKKRIIPFIVLIIYLLVNVLVYGINWLISVPNQSLTDELYKEFVGYTFSGHSDIGDHSVYHEFRFNGKENVYATKTSTYKQSDYLKGLGAKDTSYVDKETLPYKLKVTLFGKKYIYIKGYGSNGVDTFDNSKGLPIKSDSLLGFYFEYDGHAIRREKYKS